MSTETYMNEIYTLLEDIENSITPDDIKGSKDISWLYDKNLRTELYGKHPQCFMGFKGMGSKNREIPFFPICNRSGAYDPKIINLSIKLANRMKEYGSFNNKHLDLILVKLIDLHKKNGGSTDMDPFKQTTDEIKFQEKIFYKIKSYLDMVV